MVRVACGAGVIQRRERHTSGAGQQVSRSAGQQVSRSAGEEVRHVDELFGARLDLEFVLHNPSEVVDAVTAGLVDIEWYLRSPRRDVETPADRLYVLACRPLIDLTWSLTSVHRHQFPGAGWCPALV
jgi:hypothetical protein